MLTNRRLCEAGIKQLLAFRLKNGFNNWLITKIVADWWSVGYRSCLVSLFWGISHVHICKCSTQVTCLTFTVSVWKMLYKLLAWAAIISSSVTPAIIIHSSSSSSPPIFGFFSFVLSLVIDMQVFELNHAVSHQSCWYLMVWLTQFWRKEWLHVWSTVVCSYLLILSQLSEIRAAVTKRPNTSSYGIRHHYVSDLSLG